MASTVFAAADANTHKADVLCREICFPSFCIGVMRVAAVDNKIARIEVRDQVVYDGINDRSRGHKEHDVSRLFQLSEEIGECVGGRDRHAAPFGYEQRSFFRVKIVTDTGNAVLGNVKKKVPTHRPEADHPKVCIWHMRIIRPKYLPLPPR